MEWMLLTDCNCECEQSEASESVLEQVWAAGAQQGGAGAVILAVVGGVEAERGILLAKYDFCRL
jgi:hypothetical protein